ncbi:Kelch-like protein 17 [Stylophora pistillata]|uniref:Kelch-like protein 17 n=1 Tax=Stylophora pistillata TaxID=50429 RepID=A0A2B4RSP8_STYPI|nr:Kelch-like protein 17 [Stylophora pistillata]
MDLKRKVKRSENIRGSSSVTDYSESGSIILRVQHAQSLLTALENMRRRDELCDVELIVAGKEIKAHRVVLAAVSPYFNAMFTSDVVESKQKVVHLNDLDPLAVHMAVEFAYVARVNLTVDNVQSLLTVATLLQMDTLVEKCCYFLENELHPSNCLGIRRFAKNHGCFVLSKTANEYAMRNFNHTTQMEEFFQCPLEEVLELLSEDSLHVRHEEEVYEAALRWMNFKKHERLKVVPQIAEIIRFPLMAWEFLVTKVLDDGFITGQGDNCHLFEEARMYHLCPQLRSDMKHRSRFRPRKLYGQAECIYVMGGEVNPEQYDPCSDKWTPAASMIEHRSSVGVGVLDGLLYAVGGYNGQVTINTVERYNPRTEEWNMVAEMNTARSMLGVASLNGQLYAVGGYDGVTDLSSVECYNNQTNQWQLMSSMKTPRSMAGVTVLNDVLFAVGGCNHQSLESVEIYKPETDTWMIVAPMKEPRSGVGIAVIDGLLYVFGGYNGTDYLNSVEVFHPQKKRWTSATSMKTNRRRFGCCS